MANEQQPAPVAPPPASELDKVSVREVREFLQKYGPTVLIGAALAVAVAVGFGIRQNHQQDQLEKAARMLSGQPIPEEKLGPGLTPQRLQLVADRYPNTPSAPLALLALAAQFFSTGQYEPARASYQKFEERYPQHPFAPAAELGRLHCAEASTMTDIALAGYEKFIPAHPGHYLTPLAIFGKARCLEARGALDAARITYEDFLVKNSESPWEGHVRSALQNLDMKKRAQAKGVSVAQPIPAIPALTTMPAPSTPAVPHK
ncbi:MAG: tetratricopeptide repeat protein [Verrucomicrobia bacterium]|nr:MAG: tetratricopeptide repeat protein [Verrucomicrobiota bacterium]